MDIKKIIYSVSLFRFMIFILIQIKFDIEINNNELLKKYENIRKIKMRTITCKVQQHGAQVTNNLSSFKRYL
jgi:hypothetical protein